MASVEGRSRASVIVDGAAAPIVSAPVNGTPALSAAPAGRDDAMGRSPPPPLRPSPPPALQLDIPAPMKDAGISARSWAVWRRVSTGAEYDAFRGTLLGRVLGSYGAGSGWTAAQRAWALAVMSWELEFGVTGTAFQTDLRELSRRDDVGRFLHALEQCLVDAATTGERVPLFALAATYAGSPDEATRWIAVLLQDVRFRDATDDYWIGEVPKTLEPTFERLMALLSDEDIEARVDAYPPGVNVHNRGFYHYYAPAYLTRKMIAAGVPAGLAAATVTIFNAEYELNQFAAGQSTATTTFSRLADAAAFMRNGVSSGKGMAPDILEQIYAGYAGAMRAAGATARPFTELRAALLQNPRAALRSVMRDSHDRYSAQNR